MEQDFLRAFFDRVQPAVDPFPARLTYSTRRFVQQSGAQSSVVYRIEYPDSGSSNGQIIAVAVDVDVWSPGPDPAIANDIADAIEKAVVGWSVNTQRQGTVRIHRSVRQMVPHEGDENVRLARVTMRLTGRAFRRL